MNTNWTRETLARTIDHTVLKATATEAHIIRLCGEARRYRFASVCINPVWVPLAAKELDGTDTAVCTVIGFPLGASAPSVKAFEASHAVLQGAGEVDMVIDIGALKNGNADAVEADIRGVVRASRDAAQKAGSSVLVKVIIETCYLTDDEKITACRCAVSAGADFVKTSTGFGTPGKNAAGEVISPGAVISDVRLMKNAVGNAARVKASGGIRDLQTAIEMLEAGADRLGVSAGVEIIEAMD